METISDDKPEAAEGRGAFRINITVKPETKGRLDEGRNKRGIEINVSQVCDRAINAALDRAEKPGIVDVIERLKVESDRRRGVPYRQGHAEGNRWAKESASWAEICAVARFDEGDVLIDDVRWTWDGGESEGLELGFVGTFVAPERDYKRNSPHQWGAPAYRDANAAVQNDKHLQDQYWRGWLQGVKSVFELVREELEPIEATAANDEFAPADKHDIDPDDIPF